KCTELDKQVKDGDMEKAQLNKQLNDLFNSLSSSLQSL
ncbi:hypothetical protein Q604_UNBC15184G0001, partial [human gut metagenome]